LSPEDLEKITGLIAINGLSTEADGAAGDDVVCVGSAARAAHDAAADAAFAAMMAAHPGAHVLDAPVRTTAAADTLPPPASSAAPADAAGAADGTEAPADDEAAAEAAFAAMLAQHDDAKEIAPGVFATNL
jgi:hypothetical protein